MRCWMVWVWKWYEYDGGDGGDGGGDGNGGFENVLAQFYRKSLHFYRNVGTVWIGTKD